MDNYQAVRKVLIVTLLLNLSVATAKVFYGTVTQSLSMVADGLHSFFDGTSNLVGLLGIWMASHPPDASHPYGHKKFEALAALGISILLFLTGYHILTGAYDRFLHTSIPKVTILSFVIMLATMGVNAFTVSYERRRSLALNSPILHADALHTGSDILASLSVLISLGAVLWGYPWVDPAAALLIAILIGKTGFEILLDATRVLSDASMLSADAIKEIVLTVEGVQECHAIRTRGTTSHVYVDLHLQVPSGMHTDDAHNLAHQVEARIKRAFREVTDVMVHIEPDQQVPKQRVEIQFRK